MLRESRETHRLSVKCQQSVTHANHKLHMCADIPIDWSKEIRPFKQTSIFKHIIIESHEDIAANMKHQSNLLYKALQTCGSSLWVTINCHKKVCCASQYDLDNFYNGGSEYVKVGLNNSKYLAINKSDFV